MHVVPTWGRPSMAKTTFRRQLASSRPAAHAPAPTRPYRLARASGHTRVPIPGPLGFVMSTVLRSQRVRSTTIHAPVHKHFCATVPDRAAQGYAVGGVVLHPIDAAIGKDVRPTGLVDDNFRETGHPAHLGFHITLQLIGVHRQHIGQVPDAHQPRTLSQNGQTGWPSRCIRSRQYTRISAGGGSIGRPTRPGVSFSAAYQAALAHSTLRRGRRRRRHAPHTHTFAFGENTNATTDEWIFQNAAVGLAVEVRRFHFLS